MQVKHVHALLQKASTPLKQYPLPILSILLHPFILLISRTSADDQSCT